MSSNIDAMSFDERTAAYRNRPAVPSKPEGALGLVAYKGTIASLGEIKNDNITASATYQHIRLKGESEEVFLTDVTMSRRCQSYIRPGASLEIICDKIVHKNEEKYMTYAVAVDGTVVGDVEGARRISDSIKRAVGKYTLPLYMMSGLSAFLGLLTVVFFIGWIILVCSVGLFFIARKASKVTKKLVRHVNEAEFHRFCGTLPSEYQLRQLAA